MSGIDQWVPFFEEASPRRDVESWWVPIQEKVLSWGMEVQGVVSDRAGALVKLGDADYLGVASMPDLFHFMHDLGKLAGLRIGKRMQQAQKAMAKAGEAQKEAARTAWEQISNVYQSYRQQTQKVNQIIHPFDEQDEWQEQEHIEKQLTQCLRVIGELPTRIGLDVSVQKIQKAMDQIAPIAQGVANWIEQTKAQLLHWVNEARISPDEQQWMIQCALPLVYWQIQLGRTTAKQRNKELRTYYKARIEQAKQKAQDQEQTSELDQDRQQELLLMAHRLAICFQRASSHTEGRNGYLAFVNHAHKGFPNNRLEVLTVVHNYDIKRADGSTPAKRLFRQDFPDLFEFLCENVTGFKEPRARKDKSFTTNVLQH